MNYEKALVYIRKNGNPIENARLEYFLHESLPDSEIIDKFFSLQNPDRGFPAFWSGGISSIDATCFKLAQSRQLGLFKEQRPIIDAINFISEHQDENGSWEEIVPSNTTTPPWIKPGEIMTKLYLTANCGFWLAMNNHQDIKAKKAASFILEHIDDYGKIPGFLHTHWLTAGLFYKINEKRKLELLFNYLLQKVWGMNPSNLAWLILTLSYAGVSGKHPLIAMSADSLVQKQADSGCWISEDGFNFNVHTTLEALCALKISTENKDHY